jgi:hypothetical protein
VLASPRAGEYRALEAEYDQRYKERESAATTLAAAQDSGAADAIATARTAFVQAESNVKGVRTRATALVKDVTGDTTYSDVNYVFPTFILNYMPIGLVG